MDFSLSTEQQQLCDALARWLKHEYGFEQRKKIIHSETGISPNAWSGLVDLGVCALPVAQEYDGFGGSTLDMCLVMQEMGRGLVVEPYFATMLAAHALSRAGGHGELLAKIAAGEIKLACAFGERQARHDLFDIHTTATPSGGEYVLNGEKTVVLHGAQADYVLVSCQIGLEDLALFVLPADVDGLAVKDYRTIDGMRAADLRLKDVRVPAQAMLGRAQDGRDLLDAVADYARCLLCAESVGAMQALHAATLDYVKTRQQFGAPIGKFQVLQHRLAEMYMHLEQAQSITLLAALKFDADIPPSSRRRFVSAAKVRVGQAAKYIGQQAVQLHGGIGVTDELPAAHYFKRLTTIDLSFGDVDHHLGRFVAQPAFADTVA